MDWPHPTSTTTAKSRLSSTTSTERTTRVDISLLLSLRLEKRSSLTTQTSPYLGDVPFLPTNSNICCTTPWILTRTSGLTKATPMLPSTSALVQIPPSPGTSTRGPQPLNNRCDGGTNASPIMEQATCLRCTLQNTSEAVLPFANSSKIPLLEDEALRTSLSLHRQAKLASLAEPWAKSLPISASQRPSIPTKASTAIQTST